MKCVTWNINSVRSRLEHVLQFIKAYNPDVLLLQELKCQEAQFPFEAFEECGYNVKATFQKSYNGVAILSKYPLEDIHYTFFKEDSPQSRYIEAFTNGYRVISLYAPNGESVESDKFFYKLSFYKHLYTHCQTLLQHKEKLIIGGDFNIAPSDLDVYDPKKYENHILSSPQEQHHFRMLLSLGLLDAYRILHPFNTLACEHYTWWDYRKGSWPNNHGLRIDHFLLSPEAANSLQRVFVSRETRGWAKPSDHAPVCAEF